MTNLDVASATVSPRRASTVVERTVLWDGGVVEIQIPAAIRCRLAHFEDKPFVQFAKSLQDKALVNFFVHDQEPQRHCSKRIWARAQVIRKGFDDGRKYLYVDLHPVDELPAYSVWTMRGSPESWSIEQFPWAFEDCVIYKTPAPLEGAGAVVVVSKKARKRDASGKPVQRDTHKHNGHSHRGRR